MTVFFFFLKFHKMLKRFGKLSSLYGQTIGHSDVRPVNVTLTEKYGFFNRIIDLKNFHISAPVCVIIKQGRKAIKKKNEEDSKHLDFSHKSDAIFPDADLPNKSFNGILYKDLPIVNVKVTKNNTIMSLTDHNGLAKLLRSCGVEGFKNTKKGTNLAAQATALTFSRRAIDMGYKTVRVRIQGVGPGRVSSIRGLVVGGLDIVSITDNSHVADEFPRPKKLRRI